MNIYKRKDGRLERRIYMGKDENGRRRYKSVYGKTIEDIEQKGEISQFTYHTNIVITKMTVSELAAEWLMAVKNYVKESTLANYKMKLRKHIIPYFGAMKCCKLGSKDIYSFINIKIKAGLSTRYISDILVLVKSMYRYAAREYGVKNVFDCITMPKMQKKEIRLLTKSEETKLKAYILEKLSSFTLGIALTMCTGLRIGELCALQWSDIDLDARTMIIRKTIQRIQDNEGNCKTKLVMTEPKSLTSRRTIPIPECMTDMLSRFKTEDKCFLLTGTEKPMEPRAVQYRFSRILKKLGLPSVHYHALRHSWASQAIELGFDVKTLSEILGHSSIELTLRLYVHSSFEHKRSCMDKIKWSECS